MPRDVWMCESIRWNSCIILGVEPESTVSGMFPDVFQICPEICPDTSSGDIFLDLGMFEAPHLHWNAAVGLLCVQLAIVVHLRKCLQLRSLESAAMILPWFKSYPFYSHVLRHLETSWDLPVRWWIWFEMHHVEAASSCFLPNQPHGAFKKVFRVRTIKGSVTCVIWGTVPVKIRSSLGSMLSPSWWCPPGIPINNLDDSTFYLINLD